MSRRGNQKGRGYLDTSDNESGDEVESNSGREKRNRLISPASCSSCRVILDPFHPTGVDCDQCVQTRRTDPGAMEAGCRGPWVPVVRDQGALQDGCHHHQVDLQAPGSRATEASRSREERALIIQVDGQQHRGFLLQQVVWGCWLPCIWCISITKM